MASQNQGLGSRVRPAKRTATKVPSPLLRKARMVAAARGLPPEEYVEKILRPAIERDYQRLFAEGPEG